MTEIELNDKIENATTYNEFLQLAQAIDAKKILKALNPLSLSSDEKSSKSEVHHVIDSLTQEEAELSLASYWFRESRIG